MKRSGRRLPRAAAVVLAAVAVLALAATSAAAAPKVPVYFTRDDRLQIVERPLPAGADRLRAAVTSLFACMMPESLSPGMMTRTSTPRRTAACSSAVMSSAP